MACSKGDARFEQFTTMLASGVSRRAAFKYIGAATLGAMLTSVGVKQAEAANACKGLLDICHGNTNPCKACPSGQFGCFCFDHTGKRAFCGQDGYCSDFPACVTNTDCGKGKKCSYHNGCTPNICSTVGQGVCLTKCRVCPPPSVTKTGGKTAAGRG